MSVISLSSFSPSPRISGDAAQVCDSVKTGTEVTAPTCVFLLFFSPTVSFHLLWLCFPRLPLALAQSHCVNVSVCPSHLSWSLLWPHSSPFSVCSLCFSASSSSAPLCLGALLRSWSLGPHQSWADEGLQAECRPGLSPHCLLERHPDGLFAAVFRASLWSSCVVLPLLALTWMSAVLAMTDRRSILFQALFAVFNSAQGFVITAVHCFLRREVGRASPVLSHPPHRARLLTSPHCADQEDRGPQIRPQAGQPLVWKLRAWGPWLWPPCFLGLLLPSDLPLGWMHFYPSIPTWVPGVGSTASCGQGPCGGLRPAGTHCPQVQDVVKCQMGVCRADESEDSPDSCKNGQLQILVSEETWAGHSAGL